MKRTLSMQDGSKWNNMASAYCSGKQVWWRYVHYNNSILYLSQVFSQHTNCLVLTAQNQPFYTIKCFFDNISHWRIGKCLISDSNWFFPYVPITCAVTHITVYVLCKLCNLDSSRSHYRLVDCSHGYCSRPESWSHMTAYWAINWNKKLIYNGKNIQKKNSQLWLLGIPKLGIPLLRSPGFQVLEDV